MNLVKLIISTVILFGLGLLIMPQPIFAQCTFVGYKCDCYQHCDCNNDGIANEPCCEWWNCDCLGCPEISEWCCPCTGCQPCFTGETEITVGESENSENSDNSENSETKQIKDLKPGDVVESFNPETGKIKEGTVSDITKTTREGYYTLETESGEKVRVTAEHPFLAIKAKNFQFPISNFQLIDKLENIFSQTLTYRVISGLQEKIGEVLR
jgi:hypothetical protein